MTIGARLRRGAPVSIELMALEAKTSCGERRAR